MKCPPYTTKTGLKIGSNYQPPLRQDFTAEEYRIQRALLKPNDPLLPFSKVYAAGYVAFWVIVIVFIKAAT